MAPPPEVRQISMEEVKQHKSPDSLWMVIYNSVYDVTAFIKEHPGGEDALTENGGIDATIQFEDVGHSADARELMQKFKIGDLIIEKPKPNINYKEYIPHAIIVLAVGISVGYALRRFFI